MTSYVAITVRPARTTAEVEAAYELAAHVFGPTYLEARALTPGAAVTVLARSESLDSLTLDGPRGRATLGLRPAALVHVLPGEADPALFHKVPAR